MPNLVASYTPGADRNNYSGYLGMQFTVPSGGMTVSSLGLRCATGNTGNFTVYLLNSSNATVTSAVVSLTGGTTGTFYYTSITPVALTGGAVYKLVCQETSGGNEWSDGGPVTVNGYASSVAEIYGSTLTGTYTVSTANYLYIGLDFVYTIPQAAARLSKLSAYAVLSQVDQRLSKLSAYAVLFPASLTGTATGTSTATGALVGNGALTGTATGTSTATGILAAQGNLTGLATGTSTATGILTSLVNIKFFNRAKMYTTTVGTGTITLTTLVTGFQTFDLAGVADGDFVRFVIEDLINNSWGIYTGKYTTSSKTLTRTLVESSNGGSEISLSGNALVYTVIAAQDLIAVKALANAAVPNTLAALTALLLTLPTTLPGTSGLLWWNGNALDMS